MSLNTTLTYNQLLDKIETIIPSAYAKTRNFVDGDVTYLSPYISRGVISTKQIYTSLINRGLPFYACETLLKELAWRDYFQRVWQHKNINLDIKQDQEKVTNHQIPNAIIDANIGIEGIDNAIHTLYETGYMHNHCRMYVAAIACNVAGSHWCAPAQWMFYHLLDGDWGSNACSWQWVAGSNSNKKYYANQDNISKFTNTKFGKSFLDVPYDGFDDIKNPPHLKIFSEPIFTTILPQTKPLIIDTNLPTYIYNYYNVDSNWHTDISANRILLLEPKEFQQYPVSEKCIAFLLSLANQINGIQIFAGSFDELKMYTQDSQIHYKEHPLHKHYKGTKEDRDWMVQSVSDYAPSFFGYWKKLEKQIKKSFEDNAD